MLFLSAISPQALGLLKEIQETKFLEDFYLVGGTALALHYGHRVSVDLDFFTGKEFNAASFLEELKDKYSFVILSQATNSLTLNLNDVKADFIRHNYPLLKPVQNLDGIRIAAVEDIAAMKFNSMMNRGSKKDFFDIFELLNHFSLKDLLVFHAKKYNFSSQMTVLKSLVYFADAENEPDPVSIKSENWNTVKQKIQSIVGGFVD